MQETNETRFPVIGTKGYSQDKSDLTLLYETIHPTPMMQMHIKLYNFSFMTQMLLARHEFDMQVIT